MTDEHRIGFRGAQLSKTTKAGASPNGELSDFAQTAKDHWRDNPR